MREGRGRFVRVYGRVWAPQCVGRRGGGQLAPLTVSISKSNGGFCSNTQATRITRAMTACCSRFSSQSGGGRGTEGRGGVVCRRRASCSKIVSASVFHVVGRGGAPRGSRGRCRPTCDCPAVREGGVPRRAPRFRRLGHLRPGWRGGCGSRRGQILPAAFQAARRGEQPPPPHTNASWGRPRAPMADAESADVTALRAEGTAVQNEQGAFVGLPPAAALPTAPPQRRGSTEMRGEVQWHACGRALAPLILPPPTPVCG